MVVNHHLFLSDLVLQIKKEQEKEKEKAKEKISKNNTEINAEINAENIDDDEIAAKIKKMCDDLRKIMESC